jgi:hypothetical protein
MNHSSLSAKIGVVLGFLTSCSALYWLTSIPMTPVRSLARFGQLSSIFAALGFLIVCWTLSVVYLARKWNWSLAACGRSSFPFAIVGTLLFFFGNTKSLSSVGLMLTTLALFVGNLCRRLVYPKVTPEQIYAPAPPPSLFPR